MIASALRHGSPLADPMFDLIFPAEQRLRSWVHWTPIDVALRASALLAVRPGARVLDIGAGVGKLCLIGALTTDASWFGIELDANMVDAARAAAALLGVEQRATFVRADATLVEWDTVDSIYLFNPFAEGLFAHASDPLERRDTYVAYVAAVQRRLHAAPGGTRVVTYFGFGGEMPPGYELVHRELARDDELCVWERRRRPTPATRNLR
jgi:cyclopropane fatty-acyl-phospholipid synthase-like methyltransferase